MKLQTKRVICLTVLIASVLTIIGTLSYAYFSATADNNNSAKANATTGILKLRFADGDNGINETVELGRTVTKKFLIENTGTREASLRIDWVDMINTYTAESLSYKLSYSETEDGEYQELLPYSYIPTSSEPIQQTLASEISVPAGKTYYYNLDITLNVLPDVDQTSDFSAVFSTVFNTGHPIKYKYYTLSVDPNGGEWEGSIDVQEYLLQNGDTKNINNPTREGYSFDGWEIVDNTTSSKLDENVFTMGISDTTLRARWNTNKYTVTIDGEEREMSYGESIDLGTPTREGYTFTGWNTTAGTLNGTIYTVTSSDAVITAEWTINNYKYIVYHNQMNIDGNGYTLVGADTDEGEAAFNTVVNPDVKTYTGFTSPVAQSLTIKAEEVYPPVKNKIDYNYTRNQYILSINPNGGRYSGQTSQSLYYGQSMAIDSPARTGYNFTNWTASAGNLSGTTYTMGASDATLTANWTAKTFSVTFNANGGSTSTPSKTVTYDSTYEELPTPTYDGYKFLGWFTEKDGGEQVTSGTKVALSNDQTLYAHWQKSVIESIIASSNGARTSFDDPATTDEGVFEKEDDYGTSYYYRGAVTDNYVKFGKNKSGQDMYWRIIRVNGDGSLRIMYTGTQAYANGTDNSDLFIKIDQAWNSSFNDAKYAGWMYGGVKGEASTSKELAQTNETDSDIKTVVDAWYKENIVDTGYASAVADILFCNDRSTPGSSVSKWTNDTGLGYRQNTTMYGVGARFLTGNNGTSLSAYTNVKPIFTCPEKNDAFTVDDTTKGNGDLTFPVGLITVDEIVTAGSGKYTTANRLYYLYRPNNWYWSLSPSYYDSGSSIFRVYNSTGSFNYINVRNTGGAVAPVINLSAEYAETLQGTGTATDPYRAA